MHAKKFDNEWSTISLHTEFKAQVNYMNAKHEKQFDNEWSTIFLKTAFKAQVNYIDNS